MRDLLLLQLGFNILILCALLVLARPGRARRKDAASRPAAKAKQVSKPATPAPVRPHPAPKEAPAMPSSLDGLLAREDAKELVAEQALRARLDRFRSRATG